MARVIAAIVAGIEASEKPTEPKSIASEAPVTIASATEAAAVKAAAMKAAAAVKTAAAAKTAAPAAMRPGMGEIWLTKRGGAQHSSGDSQSPSRLGPGSVFA